MLAHLFPALEALLARFLLQAPALFLLTPALFLALSLALSLALCGEHLFAALVALLARLELLCCSHYLHLFAELSKFFSMRIRGCLRCCRFCLRCCRFTCVLLLFLLLHLLSVHLAGTLCSPPFFLIS